MLETKKITVGELKFDCRLAGDPTNDMVILLHGFPESSVMWTTLMTHLSSQGYFCVAPDLRGYSKGACPKGVKNYTLDKLSDDILGIAASFCVEKFHLIGHDWGALIGWSIVYSNSEKILSWTAMSVPHIQAFGRALQIDPIQKKKSRYVGFFRLPIIPEIMLRRNDFKGFRRLWKRSPPEEMDHYLSVFRRKSALTAALNYYRANFRNVRQPLIGEVVAPTLFIWGNRDLAVGRVAAEGNARYMKGDYEFLEVEGGHWLVQSNYMEVELAITNHLTKHNSTSFVS